MSQWLHHRLLMLEYLANSITIVKVWPYGRLIYCSKSSSWKFIVDTSEECNSFSNLDKLLFYVSFVIEFFIKIQSNTFLNLSLGDQYIIKIHRRISLICTLFLRNPFFLLFWEIWVKTHFPCRSPITNLIKIIV